MRDLLVTTHTPVLRSGRALRTYGVSKALAANGGLDLLYVRFEGSEPDRPFSSIPGVELHPVVSSRGPRRLSAYARAALGGVPSSIAKGLSPELAASARRLAATPDRARVVADGPLAAITLAGLSRSRPVIYCAHNFESGFRPEFGVRGAGSHRALVALERGILERAAESWMVSEADIAAAHELSPAATLRYVPNVVDVSAIEPVQPVPDAQRAVFVANFAYIPNEDGLAFLIEEIFPLVWRELPQAKLVLAGSGLDRAASEDPRVEQLGFVDDLRDAYTGASCAVVPLRLGGGTPLKLIEGLAYGLPVIASPRAVAGLAVRDEEHCLIADGPQAFARAIVRMMRDGGGDLGLRGRALAAETYSMETLTGLLKRPSD